LFCALRSLTSYLSVFRFSSLTCSSISRSEFYFSKITHSNFEIFRLTLYCSSSFCLPFNSLSKLLIIRSIAKRKSNPTTDKSRTNKHTVGLFFVFVEFISENCIFSFEFFDDASNVFHMHSFEFGVDLFAIFTIIIRDLMFELCFVTFELKETKRKSLRISFFAFVLRHVVE